MIRAGVSPDLEDLSGLFFSVWRGCDDEQAIQQVDGDPMRTLVVCATDTKPDDIWVSPKV